MAHTSAGLLKQIIVQPCGVPGANDSYLSALQSITITTNNNTVITDVGLILVMPLAANVSLEIQDPLNTWTTLMPAGGAIAQLFPSDGTNFRFKSGDTSTTRTGTYYLIQ
jgi:hypothetical protein